METKISKLELKCQMKVFVDKLPKQEPKYRDCYNCDGYTNLPCYVKPINLKDNNGI